ncbi:diguanylate cyclase/phosphodiesterase domain 2 (EAL) [Klebsiella pneumoniae]|uniref:Diguanylate cyclase/phosphodiesterase domain 2 (EAL) n=1 Tax=Klebsiella pneumoniae TaxID=573 RepID=A0A378B8N7_KLEPN|nr:diguanylate cyclase/phosphodiesterase domain 2 (EAL) [Klebsiella pneumoniae]
MHSLSPASCRSGKHQLAINLLPGSLYHHPDAVGWLMDSLLAAGLRPDQVLIEVTETEVITCFDQFRKVLKALRVAGMSWPSTTLAQVIPACRY